MDTRAPLLAALGLLAACAGPTASLEGVRDLLDDRLQSAHLDPAHLQRRDSDDDELASDLNGLLGGPIDADAAVQIALLNNRGLRASMTELDVALADLRGARRVRNPDAEISALFPTEGNESAALEFSLLVDLSDLARVGLRAGVADAEYERARVMAAAAALDLAYETRIAFAGLLAAQQNVTLWNEVVVTFRAAWESAEAMREAGNVPQLDVAQEHALYEESRLQLATAELEVLDRREDLNVLLGLTGAQVDWTTVATLAPPATSDPELETVERIAMDRSLELAAGQHRLRALTRRVGLERTRGALPALHAGVLAERAAGEWEIGPVLEVELPLFDQGQGAIGRVQAELAMALHRYEDLAIRVRSGVRRARNRYVVARERANFIRETLVPAREEVLRQALFQYNAMNMGVFQLLRAKRSHVEALQARVMAERDYWVARIALEQILAGRLVDAPELSGAMPMGGNEGGGH